MTAVTQNHALFYVRYTQVNIFTTHSDYFCAIRYRFDKEPNMYKLNDNEVLTKVTKFNLMSSGKSILIDVHEEIAGKLAAKFIAVPSLVMVIAKPEFQGTGDSIEDALQDCLEKIQHIPVENLFPQQKK